MKNIAINGFGRIGRLAFRLLMNKSDMNVVAINDLTSVEDLFYLLKYDSNFKEFDYSNISFNDEGIILNGRLIKVFKETDASKLAWDELNVDVVLECTGHYTELDRRWHTSKWEPNTLLFQLQLKEI